MSEDFTPAPTPIPDAPPDTSLPPLSPLPPPPQAPAPTPGRSAVKVAAIIVAGFLVIVALAVFGSNSRSLSGVLRGPATTLSLRDRSAHAAQALRDVLCVGQGSRNCTIDSEEGVIELTLRDEAGDTDSLNTAGDRTGFWTRADVARMGHTRALDGTQRNPSGSVSWTYHPDHGLNIVITVPPDYEAPGTPS
jgi:hypothetical protein